MAAINNLGLKGLETILNISTPKTGAGFTGSVPDAQDIVAAGTDKTIVSGLAKSIGEIYSRVKQTGNEAAISGFSKIVQGFGTGITGTAIVDVVTAATNMTSGDLETYGSTAEAIDQQGSSPLTYRFASQAASIYNADEELGRGYMNAAEAIVNAEHTGTRQEIQNLKASNLSGFMSVWDRFDPSLAANEDISAAYRGFNEQIASINKGKDFSASISDFAVSQGDSSSS